MNKKIIVVGSGNAGLLAALFYKKSDFDVTIITSNSHIQFGEATTFVLPLLLRYLDIKEEEWMDKSSATFKFSANFSDWGKIGSRFSQPFAYPGEYGYHYDIHGIMQFLEQKCIERGVVIISGTVVDIHQRIDGSIESLTTQQNIKIEGDFYIDCTGFKSLLLGQCLKSKFISYHKNISLNDRAVGIQKRDIIHEVNYTNHTALTNGWMWTIPLKTRTDYGYVYSSEHISDEAAEAELRTTVNDFTTPVNFIKYKPGRYEKAVIKNCIAVGLAGGFIEPLEATGYGFICRVLYQSLKYINGELTEDAINYNISDTYTCTKNFIDLHYYMCERNDTPYWQYYKKFKPSKERLQQVVRLYCDSVNTPHGRMHYDYIIRGMNLLDPTLTKP